MTALTDPDRLDLAALVQVGDSIVWGGAASEPTALLEVLNAQIERMPRASVLLGFGLTNTVDAARLTSRMHVKALGGAATNGRFGVDGRLDVLPAHYSELPDLVRSGDLAVDVVLVQLAADGVGQRLTLQADYVGDAIPTARVVVAEINDRAPCTFGEPPVDAGDIDICLRVSHPIIEWRAPEGGAAAREIGEQVARLIPNGATLQVGLGSIPDAVLACLGGKRDLGLHSGVIGDRVMDLVEGGVITNRRKSVDPGIGVTNALLGTDRLYRWSHRSPRLHLRASRHTHDIEVLSALPKLCGINGAIEVDLSGQINAEVAGHRHIGLIGGHADFLRGCMRSPGGRGIVALESTARGGSVSRIVASLSDGVVTSSRSDADVVVTEYGVADLRGRTLSERARALIAVAHPNFRAGLQAAAERVM